MREEVERLEDDPDPAAHRVDVDAALGDLPAGDDDPPGIDRLEQVDAAEERGLARAGRADQADDLVLGEREVDPRSTSRSPNDLWIPSSSSAGAALTRASRPAGGAGRARRASR